MTLHPPCRLKLASLVALALPLLAACSPPPGGVEPATGASPPAAEARSIESIWKAKCASCHLPVDPGTRSREALTAAFQPHRKRVKLTEDQWGQMIDFLAQK
jgi:mono/diheme cytochrome c family protein